MFGIGFNEVIIILVLALIIIGPKKLPDIAKALGKGYREFRRAFDDVKSEFDLDIDDDKDYDEVRKVGKSNKKDEKIEDTKDNMESEQKEIIDKEEDKDINENKVLSEEKVD